MEIDLMQTNESKVTDGDLFRSRPAETKTCWLCDGRGSLGVAYALHPRPDGDRIDGAPEGAVLAFVGGSFDVFSATREAAEIANRAGRPVAFQFLDHVVVVGPGKDPDQVARAWWMRQYGETPEETRSRR